MSTAEVARYRALFLPHVPTRRAIMNAPEDDHKYTDVKGTLTDAELAAHLDGSQTWAASLIGRDGLATEGAGDIDEGGEAALWRGLKELKQRDIVAYAITSENEAHTGGHIRTTHFEEAIEPDRIRRVLDEAFKAAKVKAELFPSGQNLRLPLGAHTWTGKRGRLFLQSGEMIDLDAGPAAVAAGFAAIEALPRNAASLAPRIERPAKAQPVSITTSGPSVIADFNRDNSALTLIEGYGGRIAQRSSNGDILVHCPCGGHKHGDRRPSLLVRKATSSRYGTYVVLGYSPDCRFYTERGQVVDAFGVYTRMESLDAKAAVKRLAPPKAEQQDGPTLIVGLRPEQRADAQRKREARRAEATATIAEIRERLAADTVLPKRARAVLTAMLDHAAERAWCRPSKARLAEMTGYKIRTVAYALRELEQAGYITSHDTHGAGTWRRTFLRVQKEESAAATVATEIAPVYAREEEERTCDRPPATAPTPEPEMAVPDAGEVEVVTFDGGASYDPMTAEPRFRPEPSPEAAAVLADLRLWERLPPKDPVKAEKYGKLLGAANKAKSERQRRKLRALADGMLELRRVELEPLRPSTPVLVQPPAGASTAVDTAGGRSQAQSQPAPVTADKTRLSAVPVYPPGFVPAMIEHLRQLHVGAT